MRWRAAGLAYVIVDGWQLGWAGQSPPHRRAARLPLPCCRHKALWGVLMRLQAQRGVQRAGRASVSAEAHADCFTL